MPGGDYEYARIPCGQGTDIFGIVTGVEAANDGRVIIGGQPFDAAEARNLLVGLVLAVNIADECVKQLQARAKRDV
jgi:hypothetical protein